MHIWHNRFCAMVRCFSEIIDDRLRKFGRVFSRDLFIAEITGMNSLFKGI